MARKSKPSELVVSCEWASCSFKGKSMEELCDHTALHLKEHLGDGEALEELDDYACLWNGCEFIAIGSPRELVVHVNFHTFHAKLKCIGSQLLLSHPELRACSQDLHSKNLVPELSGAFECQWEHCDSTFNNPEWFYRHVDMHAQCTEKEPLPNRQDALACCWRDCDATFKIKYRLREHLRSHTQERVVSCPTCGCMFASNTKFSDHIQRQCVSEESLVCEHCDKPFANERLLRDHVRQHEGVCIKHYQSACMVLLKHWIGEPRTLIVTRVVKDTLCLLSSSFKNSHDLRKHTETHNEGAAYHCDVEGCTYSSRMAHSMSQHYKRVHEGDMVAKYKCHLCDKCFSWCYTLTLHLRKKHQLKWPSGHSRFRYKEDEDGYLRLNMVRYETVEVTEQIMKNMVRKRTPRKLWSSQPRRSGPAAGGESSQSSGMEPEPQPVYCALSNVTSEEEEEEEEGQGLHTHRSGAVEALTEVARGLGIQIV
ncbi:histone H4 mRNAion factor [Huso huso]|uniref:Histone H4 mRNAion factor n=1 Tax=Huso huso TaxID=61971 RepID=A0ABR0ZN60_HUSHU